MKPTVDFFGGALSLFIQNERFKNKILKLFSTTTVSGEKVFKKNFQVYPGTSSADIQEVLQLFGMADSVNNQEWEGIESAWLYFNPEKTNYKTYETQATKDYIQTKLNNLYDLNVEYEFNLNIMMSNIDKSFHLLTNQQKIDYVIDNYDLVFDQSFGNSSGNEESINGLCKYLMYDNDEYFEVELSEPTLETYIKRQKSAHKNTYGIQEKLVEYLDYSASFKMTVKRVGYIQQDSNIVTKLVGINTTYEQNYVLTALANTRNTIGSINSDRIPVTNTIFFQDYLRFSLTDKSLFRTEDFNQIVLDHIDIDYQKEKTKWYKKLIAAIIFIVAIIFAAPSGGGSLSLTQVAYLFAVVAIELTVISLVLSKSGYVDIANSLGAYIKISSMVSTVAGIGSVIASVARQGLMTYASVSIQGMSTFSVSTIKNITMVADFFYKNKLDKIQTSNNALQSKLDEQEKALIEEANNEYNIPGEYIKFQYDLLSSDNLEFEVDYKYEGTKLNIQRRSFV